MSLYWPLPDARRNPFSSRKRVSGRLLPGKQAAKHGGLSGHMRILDTRLARIQTPPPGFLGSLAEVWRLRLRDECAFRKRE